MSTLKHESRPIETPRRGNKRAWIGEASRKPTVIINADDWGRDVVTTNNILDCVLDGSVSSASAMVFMADSERSALLAKEHHVDTGLHLNFTLAFDAVNCPAELKAHQAKVSRFLRSNRFAPVLYHPGLARSFKILVAAQLEEYKRLFGEAPRRVDGHHHMHLAANVLLGRLLPAGTTARRNFSFAAGEKSFFNRSYRRWQDWLVTRRHRSTSMFFALPPLKAEHLTRIFEMARRTSVEIECHPGVQEEYRFLHGGGLAPYIGNVTVARSYALQADAATASPAVIAPATRQNPERTALAAVTDPCRDLKVAPGENPPHISVCICTYKRPEQLRALLTDLSRQHTCGLFTFSIVVADNDPARSAEFAVAEVASSLPIPVKYCSEPQRGIARARNKVLANATGDYLALIDDDEFPIPNWLLSLYTTLHEYKVDGVLGPVKRHFEVTPPDWFKKSSLYDRRVNPTGTKVHWHEARTGNVLMSRELVASDPEPFKPEFRAGEDQDFFRRHLTDGRKFIWSSDAAVFEVIPPARWRRTYIIRKALLHGVNAAQQNRTMKSVVKSIAAVPVYTLCLPFVLLAGQDRFMELTEKLCNHLGKLLYLMKINPIREEYVSD